MLIGSNDFKIIRANNMFCQILGYNENELIGRTFAEITHPEDVEKNIELAEKLYNNQIPNFKAEKRYIRKNGETIWAKITATNIWDDEGKVIYGLVMVEDITREKLIEKQLIQTEKFRTVGEISALISHEYRNSLTSIRMLLELLQESENLNASENKSLLVVLNSVNHLESITAQLLKFSKPAPVEFRLSKLNDIVEDSLYFMNSHLKKRKIKLNKSLDTTLEPINLDAKNLKEAIVNLLFNSIDAIASNNAPTNSREISVKTKKHHLGSSLQDLIFPDVNTQNNLPHEMLRELELELPANTACAVIEICDTGVGIDTNHMKKIFDPFFTTKDSGTGLGLSMVKRIVNSHGGIINVASEIGRGTKFCIYLPLRYKE